MQDAGQNHAYRDKVVPAGRKKCPCQKKTDYSRTQSMKKIRAKKSISGQFNARKYALVKKRNEKKGVFNGGKSKSGSHHIDHRVDRLVKIGPVDYQKSYRSVFHVFF